MAQGQIKKPASSANKASASSSSNRVTKKGLGQKNPKKATLISAAKINKKFTSGLTAQTERMLGERAGHLEMLGQGRSKKSSSAGPAAAHGKKGGDKRKGTKR